MDSQDISHVYIYKIYIYMYAKPVVKSISWIFTIYQLVKDWTGFSSMKNQLSGLTTRIIHHPKSMKLTKLDFLTMSDLTQQPIKTLTIAPWWFYIFDSRTNQLATSGGRKPWSNLKPMVPARNGTNLYGIPAWKWKEFVTWPFQRGFDPRTQKESRNIFQSHHFWEDISFFLGGK